MISDKEKIEKKRDEWLNYLFIIGILGLMHILANLHDFKNLNIYSGTFFAIFVYLVFIVICIIKVVKYTLRLREISK
jgi:hypothetical protein